MVAQARLSQPDLEVEINHALAALQEIDRWYDWESKLLQSHPHPVRLELIDKLEERHRCNREPYVQHVAHIYHILNSTRLFKDSHLLSMRMAVGPTLSGAEISVSAQERTSHLTR